MQSKAKSISPSRLKKILLETTLWTGVRLYYDPPDACCTRAPRLWSCWWHGGSKITATRPSSAMLDLMWPPCSMRSKLMRGCGQQGLKEFTDCSRRLECLGWVVWHGVYPLLNLLSTPSFLLFTLSFGLSHSQFLSSLTKNIEKIINNHNTKCL
jgi:hypothetical protein